MQSQPPVMNPQTGQTREPDRGSNPDVVAQIQPNYDKKKTTGGGGSAIGNSGMLIEKIRNEIYGVSSEIEAEEKSDRPGAATRAANLEQLRTRRTWLFKELKMTMLNV